MADGERRVERKRALSKPIWPWIALAVAVAPTTARAQTALNSTTAAASPSAGAILTNTTNPPRARVIEWNLPAQGDASPGAVVVDTQGHDANRMWFVTRVGLNNPHLYRMEFPKSLMKGSAKWTSWKLNAILAGGIRRVKASYDRRFIFVRTISSSGEEAVERVETDPTKCNGINCSTTVWQDFMPGLNSDVSDVAVDEQNNVFTTHSPNSDPLQSYVQRLTPG